MTIAHYATSGTEPSDSSYRDEDGHSISREAWLLLIERRRNPFYRYPSDPNQKLWRYMDFTKFVSLLEDKALFLPSASRFDDVFEGAVSSVNAALIDKQITKYIRDFKSMDIPSEHEAGFRSHLNDMYETLARRREWVRHWTYVSCWHTKDYESAALWRLYSKSDDVVAVQSTFQKLFDCLRPHVGPPHGEPKIGLVNYYDPRDDIVRTNVHLSEFFYKLKAFEHEEELRIVTQELPLKPRGDSWVEDHGAKPPGRKKLSLDVAHLVERIYVSPYGAEWLVDLATRVVKRHGLDCPVLPSFLEGPVMFRSAVIVIYEGQRAPSEWGPTARLGVLRGARARRTATGSGERHRVTSQIWGAKAHLWLL